MPDPISYSIRSACATSGLGRSTIYELVAEGKLKAVKAGGKTLIIGDSLRNLIAQLPAANITTGLKRRKAEEAAVP